MKQPPVFLKKIIKINYVWSQNYKKNHHNNNIKNYIKIIVKRN